MKKVLLFVMSASFAAAALAQTERVFHESLGGTRQNFRANGRGNFGEVPMNKIVSDSILIDSIMKDIEKKKIEEPQKQQQPLPKSKPARKKPAPSKQANKPAAISTNE